MRKSDVPFINKSKPMRIMAAYMVVFFTILALFVPDFRHALPGILDGIIGVTCGVFFGRVCWKYARRYAIRDYEHAEGDIWRYLRNGQWSYTRYLWGATYFASVISAYALTWVLKSHLGLQFPWCRGDEYAPGAGLAAFFSFFLTFLLSHANWYDSLPD